MSSKKTLGRGLHSLIPEVESRNVVQRQEKTYQSVKESYDNDKKDNGIRQIDLNKIIARTNQPRKSFSDESLEELAASIKEYGLLNPIVVRKVNDSYEIVAGERRFRASKLAGLNKIDAIVREYENKEVEVLALIENVQREDLRVLEEAEAYKKLSDEYSMTQEQIAKTIGKSRSYIANTLRLLKLNENEKFALNSGKISPSQARTLLSIEDINERQKALEEFKTGKTNIRKIEKKSSKANTEKVPNIDDILLEDLQEKLMDELNSKVSIRKEKNMYKLAIDCFSIEDIEGIYNRIKNETNWYECRHSNQTKQEGRS